jgi:hypothetical protein
MSDFRNMPHNHGESSHHGCQSDDHRRTHFHGSMHRSMHDRTDNNHGFRFRRFDRSDD